MLVLPEAVQVFHLPKSSRPGVCLFGKDVTTSSHCSGVGLGRIGVEIEFKKDKQKIDSNVTFSESLKSKCSLL